MTVPEASMRAAQRTHRKPEFAVAVGKRTHVYVRAHDAIERLCREPIDSEGLRREAMARLQTAVPSDGWCWSTVDPAAMSSISAVVERSVMSAQQQKLWEIEYEEPVITLARLSSGPVRVGVLSEATRGDPARSRRWSELMRPHGIADELRAALVVGGRCWGSLTLYRDRSTGPFSARDREWVEGLVPHMAEQSRRTFASIAAAPVGDAPMAAGVLVLDGALRPLGVDGLAAHWLTHLPGRVQHPAQPLPALVYALVARARAGLPARARARTTDGRWVAVQASRVMGAATAVAYAVVIQPVTAADVIELRMDASRLSRRERELCSMVLRGRSTVEIADALFISNNTVRDHLKAVFDKVGVRSRGELAAVLQGGRAQGLGTHDPRPT